MSLSPNNLLEPTIIPLCGLSAAELRRYVSMVLHASN